jgi:hypothetical protein
MSQSVLQYEQERANVSVRAKQRKLEVRMVQHWGHTDVRLFTALTHDDRPQYVGAYAEVRRGYRVELLRSLGGADWFRVEGTADDLKARDFALVAEQEPAGFADADPSTVPALQHLLEQVELARQLATAAHAGQTDKAGRPYIDHRAASQSALTTCRRRPSPGSTT